MMAIYGQNMLRKCKEEGENKYVAVWTEAIVCEQLKRKFAIKLQPLQFNIMRYGIFKLCVL
jgi:hypothetical protein